MLFRSNAIELDPQSAGALVNLGTIYFHLRKWDEAERYYRQALDADPSYELAHFNLGNLFDEKGDLVGMVVSTLYDNAGQPLNLAHAVLLIGYEWFVSGEHAVGRPPLKRRHRRGAKASNEEVLGFFEHLERELEAAGFLYPPEKAPRMVRNLRNMFHRTGLTEQDVRTLRGVVKALVEGGPGRYRKKPPA